MRKLRGSYSIVVMIDGIIYAFRDPLGIKPFCIGKTENGYMVASESVAVDALSAKFIRDVKPGELVRIDADGVKCTQIATAGKRAHCIFEYIYLPGLIRSLTVCWCIPCGDRSARSSLKKIR